MKKAQDAFRTISEVATELDVQKHVLRFWEGKFPQIKPMKRGGGRRYYRPDDMELLAGIRVLLHSDGYTIKGVQKILREQGVDAVKQARFSPGQGHTTKKSATLSRSSSKRTPLKTPAKSVHKRSSAAVATRDENSDGERDAKKHIASIIEELEACRTLLTGNDRSKSGKARMATTSKKSKSA